ncbi:UPF0149 family protein [Alteromonas facilis]|uniref:UPF0149 family protein n=1 Tax=Alteromonas facilis TaxID=2048004 RepID=UPI000C28A21A|nr:UPF0149 family protein [Alteromonas facilis]
MSALEELYNHPNCKTKLRSKAFVEGVIGAVSCAPEIPMPPQWMPWAFNPSQPPTDGNDDLSTFEQITDALINQLRDTLAILRSDGSLLPGAYQFDGSAGIDSEQAQWLTGFLFAHQQLQPVWQNAWDNMQTCKPNEAEDAAKTLRHCLKVFSVLADPEAIMAKDTDSDLIEQLPSIARTLPRAILQYSTLANTLASHLPNQFESFTQQQSN